MNQQFLHRAALLFGDEALERIGQKRVILFGCGGVGSWCAEGLIRSGVTHLTIVDSDCVCTSNINRQLMATASTLGRVKVDALRERLLDINPVADIVARQERFTTETASAFDLDSYDYVVDAIDSLSDKALLIVLATQSRAKLFSSMGAALKLDPTRIRVAEFWRVQGDPLARALRHRFKSGPLKPRRKFLCVFSDELQRNQPTSLDNPDEDAPLRQPNGSLVHITAIFGFTLAGLLLKDAAASSASCD